MQRHNASTAEVMALLADASEPLKNTLSAHLRHLEGGGTTAAFLEQQQQQQQARTSSAGTDAVKDVAGPADRSGAVQLQRKSSSGMNEKSSLLDIRGRLEQLKFSNKGGGVLTQAAAPAASRGTIMAEGGLSATSSESTTGSEVVPGAPPTQQSAAVPTAAAAPQAAATGGFGGAVAPGSIGAVTGGVEGGGRHGVAAAAVTMPAPVVSGGLEALRARMKAVQPQTAPGP
jgi:hypothetical protein